jgi:hypothetical protein
VGVKATWHADVAVDVDDSDPFADEADDAPSLPVRVSEVGVPIDLSGDDGPKLSERLTENIQRQSALFNAGVDCDLRWNSAVTCHACPLYAGEKDSQHGELCRLAREEEVLSTLLVVQARGGGLE